MNLWEYLQVLYDENTGLCISAAVLLVICVVINWVRRGKL